MTAKHAHEMEAAGEVRWTAKMEKGLVMVTDKASGETYQATGYTVDDTSARFQLAGDGGLRVLNSGDPGFAAFAKVLGGTLDAPAATTVASADKK